MNRKNKKKTNTKTENRALGLIAPTAHAPPPPDGWVATHETPAIRAYEEEVARARATADEIEASPGLADALRPHVTDPEPLVGGLRAAHDWSQERQRAEAWLAYVTAQTNEAWDQVLVAARPLRRAFDNIAGIDPTLAARYPALAKFFGVRRSAGKRGGATKRRKKSRAQAPTPTPVNPPPVKLAS